MLFHKILEKTNAHHINEVWPNLELYIHGGVSFTPYQSQFDKLLPSGVNYLETYNASEGFFGIQDQKNSDELLLMLDYGMFYEFIPTEKLESQNAVAIWDVEIGVNYALVISTNAGLWRYLIGDTITFTSKHPYRFKITGRISHFINAFGEELIMDNAEKALKYACDKNNAIVNEYTVGPKFMSGQSKGAHEWIIEFENPPHNIDEFTDDLDQMLVELNSDYGAKRYNDMALLKPIIHLVEQGTFYKWMKSKNKLGRQFKVPRLANHRDYLDSILNLIQTLNS